jgi:hypothetical protein
MALFLLVNPHFPFKLTAAKPSLKGLTCSYIKEIIVSFFLLIKPHFPFT